jgi:phage portal protein BeeE
LILSSILARMPPGLSPMYQMGDIWGGWSSSSGKTVTVENAKNVATEYRCINVLSDDVAKIPLYTYKSPSRFQIDRIMPDAAMENIAWLLEVSPKPDISKNNDTPQVPTWLKLVNE